MRTIVLYTALAFIALAAAVPSSRDGHEREKLILSSITGVPVQLLDDEAAAAAFAKTGYLRSAKSLQPQLELVLAAHERGNQELGRYCAAESSRIARHLESVFHTNHFRRMIGEITADRRKLSAFTGATRCIGECRRRLDDDRDRSADIETALERSIAELELVGCGLWTDKTFETLADYHFAVGDEEKGLRCLEESLRRVVETNHSPLVSYLAGRIGTHHLRKGNLQEAEDYYLLSLSSAERSGDPYYIGRSLSFLGSLRATEGYFVEAESLLVRSCRCAERSFDPNASISRSLMLARLLHGFGETERAAGIAERSTLLAEEMLSDTSSAGHLFSLYTTRQYLASGLGLLSRIHREKDRFDEAIASARRALAIARAGDDPHFRAELEKQLGDAYAAAGDGKEAMSCYERALSVSRRLRESRSIAEYETAVARLLYRERRFGEARDLAETAVRTAAAEDHWMQRIDSTHLLGRAMTAMGDTAGGKRLFAEAIELFESESRRKPYEEDRHALRGLIDSIYADVIEMESRDPRRMDSFLFWIERSRQRDSPLAAALGADDIDERIRTCIRSTDWIPRGVVVVQYTILPGRLVIALTDGRGSESRWGAVDNEKLEADVFAFAARCRRPESPSTASARVKGAWTCRGGERGSDATGEISSRLFATLIDPIAGSIDSSRTICVIPDGVLRFVPFGALMNPDTGRFLIESNTLLVSPSLIDLHRMSRLCETAALAGPACHEPLLIGAPDIPPLARRIYPHLDSLPRAGIELTRLARLLGADSVIRGAGATKEAFLRRIESADLVHIASHTVRYPIHSGSTAILFSFAAPIAGEKDLSAALLTDREISRLDLDGIRLVVLSACESVWGSPMGAHGRTGLAASFIGAGAGTVVASIWPVEDIDIERFITAFYEELATGSASPLDALCSAQRAIIARDRLNGNCLQNIRIWAPLVCVGAMPPSRAIESPPKVAEIDRPR